MTSTNTKPATWFWVVSTIALIWNLMGVMAYLAQVQMTPEASQALSAPEQEYYKTVPSWAISAFAIAVWGGTLGSALLLMRMKLATALLILSFAGIIIQLYHSFFIANSFQVFGPGGLVMPIMVFSFGLAQIWFARKATINSWLK